MDSNVKMVNKAPVNPNGVLTGKLMKPEIEEELKSINTSL